MKERRNSVPKRAARYQHLTFLWIDDDEPVPRVGCVDDERRTGFKCVDRDAFCAVRLAEKTLQRSGERKRNDFVVHTQTSGKRWAIGA